jgi:hypothetical protein
LAQPTRASILDRDLRRIEAEQAVRLIVPARQALSVATDRPDGEALSVSSGGTNLSLGGCLFDPPPEHAA